MDLKAKEKKSYTYWFVHTSLLFSTLAEKEGKQVQHCFITFLRHPVKSKLSSLSAKFVLTLVLVSFPINTISH